jgi:predicted transcriptional regulator
MQNRGEIIKQAVNKSGMSITHLSKSIGKSRKWVYDMFENESVSLDVILQVGEIIHHNFTTEIDDLYSLQKGTIATSLDNENNSNSVEYWKNKYLILLEEYNTFLKENNNLAAQQI